MGTSHRRRPQSRYRIYRRNYMSNLTWEHLGIPEEDLEDVADKKDTKSSTVMLLLP